MNDEGLTLDPERCALIIQDLQNDVMMDGGAFAETGAPEHAKAQNIVANVRSLADMCRSRGIPVIHVHYIVEEGAPGLKVNARTAPTLGTNPPPLGFADHPTPRAHSLTAAPGIGLAPCGACCPPGAITRAGHPACTRETTSP